MQGQPPPALDSQLACLPGPQVLQLHPGYQLTLVGHSMGAGTASLMAHSLTHLPSLTARLPQGTRVRCVGEPTHPSICAALQPNPFQLAHP